MRKSIKIFGKSITLTLRNEGDYAIATELFLENQYRHCDEVIRTAKNPIIDIGGHLGFFSLYAALMNPNVPIYTYEPHEGNYQLLKENLKQNHISNVSTKQSAVSNKIGQATLKLSTEDLNHALVNPLEPTGETQAVQSTTLEKIFLRFKIYNCDLLKVDCEGSEYAILYNTPKEVFEKIDHLFIEYHNWIEGESSKELKKYLEKMGYKVTVYPNHKIKELGFFWCKK